MIYYLTHNEIDLDKWDNCILKSYNSMIYGESWYLDIVSPEWEALVLGDYEAVMPLPKKKKYGISFLAQPFLTQQSGIFSEQKIDKKIIKRFIQKIPYWSYCINMNSENCFEKAMTQPNYVLDLQQSYDKIYLSFSQNTQRNVLKSKKAGIVIKNDLLPNIFLDFYFSTKKYLESNKNIISKLITVGFERKKLSLYGAYTIENKLVATLCLLHSKNRLIYLLPVSNEEGKKTFAMFVVINEILCKNAEKSIILDFEGSRIEGVARFYRGFGARLKPYYQIRRLRPKIIFG